MSKRAILSVYDKTGLIGLGRGLVALGWRLIASGGTARALISAEIPVTTVAEVTQSPEILGGRVKTLHPTIHGGILAQDSERDHADLAQNGIQPIDLVVCNLYPFEQTIAATDVTLAEAVEQIDIGGVTLLRAAAKNHKRVTVVCDPSDYDMILGMFSADDNIETPTRLQLAIKAFAHTRDYDIAITKYLSQLIKKSE